MKICNNKIGQFTMLLMMSASISGCSQMWERVQNVGTEPAMSPITNPTEAKNYQPVSQPMPVKYPEQYAGVNSLWKKGSSGFFQDQRASKVGDIITVNISAKDTATLKNKTDFLPSYRREF